MTATKFSGLTVATVTEIVGREAAQLLLGIDHRCLAYGEHWRYSSGRQVFNESGLEVIAAELAAQHPEAAASLRLAVKNAVAAESAAGAHTASNWSARWEADQT